MRVAEQFYSLQGEGGRAGEPSLFIRLSGCSAKHACYAAGVRCDTEFESGREVAVSELLEWAARSEHYGCRWVVWTGGEPLDQLTPEVALAFKEAGFLQALETSGVRPLTPQLRSLLDYVAVSPKVAEHVLARHFAHLETPVDELRYVRHEGQPLPEPTLASRLRLISPHSDGDAISPGALRWAIQLCLTSPGWRLSVQQHKLWKVR